MRLQQVRGYHEVKLLFKNSSVVGLALLIVSTTPVSGIGPLMTGEIEDGDAQRVEMPRLPGSFHRAIEWMAPEGTEVKPGDLVLKLDPGDLETQQETAEIRIDEEQTSIDSQLASHELSIFDAETNLYRLESTLTIAELNAMVPKETIPALTYERNRLALLNATNALKRGISQLENAIFARDEYIPLAESKMDRTRGELDRLSDAIEKTEVFAEQPGLIIYAEHPYTGLKIFPGESYSAGTLLLIVASRDVLQFRFWVHESDVRKLELGDAVLVTPDAVGSTAIGTSITWISSQASEREDWSNSGYFEVVTRPSEIIPGSFIPGMSVMGELVN